MATMKWRSTPYAFSQHRKSRDGAGEWRGHASIVLTRTSGNPHRFRELGLRIQKVHDAQFRVGSQCRSNTARGTPAFGCGATGGQSPKSAVAARMAAAVMADGLTPSRSIPGVQRARALKQSPHSRRAN
jgi:hypothetical protein